MRYIGICFLILLGGCTSTRLEQRSALAAMRDQLIPIFNALGVEGQPQLDDSVLSGSFEVEPGRSWTSPDGKTGGGYTAYPRTNGVMFFAWTSEQESWRRLGKVYPEMERMPHGERYTHWFRLSTQAPSWIGVSIYYGPEANTNVVEGIKRVVELQAREMNNNSVEDIDANRAEPSS